jgi:hypothetical protein
MSSLSNVQPLHCLPNVQWRLKVDDCSLSKGPQSVAAVGTAPGKTSQGSVASTRATSPSSSIASSEEVSASNDSGELARRRGHKVLCLTELIVDEDADGGSPSANSSTSSSDAASVNSTRCAPYTPQMMSFSPPTSTGNAKPRALPAINEIPPIPAMGVVTNQVAERSMMRTSPVRIDASQRSAPVRLGGAAAGGDASQRKAPCAKGFHAGATGGDASKRTPAAGRVSLGTAVIGGDASQRSPPACMNHKAECDYARRCSPSNQFQQGFISTCPVSSGDSSCPCSAQDASQRAPAGSPAVNLGDGCNDALKSWLSGSCCDSSPQSSAELAQMLLAAQPESYED